MKIKIIERGVTYENSPFADLLCFICGSKSVDIEMEIPNEVKEGEVPKTKAHMTCSCGAKFEMSDIMQGQ